MITFNNFLKVNSKKKLISEACYAIDQKIINWPEMPIENIMRIMKFSTNWNNGLDYGVLKIDFKDQQELNDLKQKIKNYDNLEKYIKIIQKDNDQSSSSQKTIVIPCPFKSFSLKDKKGKGGVEIKAAYPGFRTVLDDNKIQFKLGKYNNLQIQIQADSNDMPKIYSLWKEYYQKYDKFINNEIDQSTLENIAQEEYQNILSNIKQPEKIDLTNKSKEEIQKIQKQQNEQKRKQSEEAREKAKSNAIEKLQKLKQDGKLYPNTENKIEDLISDVNVQQNNIKVEVQGEIGFLKFVYGLKNNIKNFNSQQQKQFEVNLNFPYLTNKTFTSEMKWLASASYQSIYKDKKISIDELCEELRKIKISLKIKSYYDLARLNKIEELRKDKEESGIDSEKASNEAVEEANNIDYQKVLSENFSNILDFIEKIKEEKDNQQSLVVQPVYISNAAKRRKKLFEDAKKLGATVFSNKDFIIAITTTSQQNHIFGRLKPKVDDYGNIKAECNLNDDEGITAENIQIRDDIDYPYIQDNIVDSFDKDGRNFNSVRTEAKWCTTGAISQLYAWNVNNTPSYWNSYNGGNGQKYPYYVLMNTTTGQMWQCSFLPGHEYFLDEFDQCHGKSAGSSECMEFMKNEFYKKYPAAKQLLEMARGINEKDAQNILIEQANITDSGKIIIESKDQISTYSKIFNLVNGIVIHNTNASQWFMDTQFTELPQIDCNEVINATRMFEGCQTPIISLINTHHIKDMTGMFEHAKINKIKGLQTNSAEHIDSIMYETKVSNHDILHIDTTLNLQNCKSMNLAFMNSGIRKISLINTDNITTAKNAFQYCKKLQVVPNVIFKKIISIECLTSSKSNSAMSIFDGCVNIQEDRDFNDKINQIEEAYKTHIKNVNVDEKGYLIINNRDEAEIFASQMYKFPGITINVEDATGIFSNIGNLRFKMIDLTKVKIANQMFLRSNILSLNGFYSDQTDEVKREEGHKSIIVPKLYSIISAEEMFGDTKINKIPNFSMPNVENASFIFSTYDGIEWDSLPDVKFGNKILPTDAYLFGEDSNSKKIQQQAFANHELWSKWYKRILNSSLNSIKPNKDGFIEFETRDSFVTFMNSLGNVIDEIFPTTENANSQNKAKGIKFNFDNIDELFIGILPDILSKIPAFDLQSVKSANYLFKRQSDYMTYSIVNLPEFLNVDHIETAKGMFKNLHILNNGKFKLSTNFNSLKIADYMFSSCYIDNSAYRLTFESTDLDSVESARHMFQTSKVLKDDIDISILKFQHLLNADSMFSYIRNPIKILKAKWNSIQNSNNMFTDCFIKDAIDIEMTSTSSAIGMFSSAYGFKIIKNLKFPNVINARSLLNGCKNLNYIGKIDLSSATNLERAFSYDVLLDCILSFKFKKNANLLTDDMFKRSLLSKKFGKNGETLKKMLNPQNANN